MQRSRPRRPMPANRRRTDRRSLARTALVAVGALALAACGGGGSSSGEGSGDGGSDGGKSAAVSLSPVTDGKKVIPGEPLTVKAQGGKLKSVAVTGQDGRALDGKVSADGSSWRSADPTGYGSTYRLKARLAGSDGKKVLRRSTVTTLGKKDIFVGTYNVEKGTTVGTAMPVSIVFNKPVRDKAAVERKLKVTVSPQVEGSWSWMKDRDGKDRVDYRPRKYWKPGTEVTLRMKLTGVKNGDLVGTQDREIRFSIGESVVSTVDVKKKTVTVEKDGKVVRTLPVSTGKPGFETWNGTMVVMEKMPSLRMNSESVGIFGQEAYDLGSVKWDIRLTTSGTFAHAAPWNEGKFGRVNGSHGCIGLSTSDAKWFYEQLHVGDPVTVVKSTDTVQKNNGYGAWNVDWATWKKGSALD